MPLISVVMAVHNGERYLRDAVDSILNQTLGDFEFLILEDGSTDGTREILNAYADPRIRVLANEQNIGLTRSLNRGLRLARGEFVARQDADDVSEPQRFEKQVAFLRAHPDVALVGTAASIIDAKGVVLERQRPACESRELRWTMLFGNPFIHTAVMLRRAQVLRTVGFYDETFVCAQDYELWFRITDELPVANIPEFLVRRRVHSQAITRTRPESLAAVNRLRYERIAPLVGWGALAAEECESRLAIMPALYFGWAESFHPAVLAATVDDMLRLHREFCGREGLPAPPLARSERALRSRIAGNLVMLTVFCSTVDAAVRRRLLARAWQLDRRVFLHPRALARAVRALAGTYIPQLRRLPKAARASEPAGRA